MRLTIVLYTEGLSFTGDTIDKQALGGAETAFICVARELARMGHDVTAFCPCTEPGEFGGVVYRDRNELPTWCETGRCDLFICSRFFEVFALNIPASSKILWCHDFFAAEQFQRLESFLPFINGIYCLSAFHRDHFIRHLPAWTNKIRQTHNGLDLSLADDAARDVPKAHKIMYTSRPERGLMRALDIYESLADRTLEFVICSYDYPWKDFNWQGENIGAIEQSCKSRIEALRARGFPIRSDFFSKQDLYRELAESKAVIYPTETFEITPISALEAQACRAVYLAPDHSGFREVVAYERLDLADTDRWLAFLHEVLTDETKRARLVEEGWRHVQPFTWAKVADEFAQNGLFDDLLVRQTTASSRIDRVNLGGSLPKISCVMPTQDRTILAKEAIRCFLSQTYPNKELVIVAGGSQRSQIALSSYIADLERPDIRCICLRDEKASLGRMRNISMDAAQGDFVCIWDDDDLYHPERLHIQASAILSAGASACYLSDYLHYFARTQELYWVDLRRDGRAHGKAVQMLPTLTITKDHRFRYPEHGTTSRIGEDSAMQDAITGQMKIVNLSGHGYIYVYRYHSRNTWPESHHRWLADAAAPVEYILLQMPHLADALQHYRLPVPTSIRARYNQEVVSFSC